MRRPAPTGCGKLPDMHSKCKGRSAMKKRTSPRQNPAFATTQPATVPSPGRRAMATAPGEVGADPPIGYCACLRRELSGEPDVGNLHLRFDEGRVGRACGVALSPIFSTSCTKSL